MTTPPASASLNNTLPPTSKLPFTPPFFYGWIIVACAVINAFMGTGTLNVVISVLLKPIGDETGWSRTMIASALGTGAIASGLMSPWAGKLADRFGGRVLMPAGGFICGVLYIALAQATAFPVFLLCYAVNRAIAWTCMNGVVSTTTVSRWFDAHRPRAMGFVAMANGLGTAGMAVFAQFLLGDIGWRGIMMIYGVLTLTLVVGPGALLIRRSPEEAGLVPDGLSSAQRTAEATTNRHAQRSGGDYPWTLSEAMRTPALWLITASASIALFGITGVSVHQIAYFTDHGMAPEAAAGLLAVYTFSSAAASLAWGFATERFDERICAAVSLVFASGCVWLLTTVDSTLGAFIFVALFGTCARGSNTLVAIVFAQYYGRSNFGAISGFAAMFQTFAGAAGPLVTAIVFDVTGSYLGMFNVLLVLFLASALLMFLAKRPVPQSPTLTTA